ncbi:hypothetical protein POJ06DRAFT_263160 [Lipomyces tetrasporus]|uniref:Uncharacterized protein n=1 Tax=Lipomyces tetrasporus TaxID=54092 RepID=A0AAD7QK55_9ASCO|nr:uncharacterized protein POJ06DRAFT_263160 [Lipomyces tetrasporus]KAJ8096695.1 hypothetical protein POJ06DRAFT_263160 [Lipomyces tetrasporus]
MLFTNFAVSFGPSIMQASDVDAGTQAVIRFFGLGLFLISKIIEVMIVTGLISDSPSLSGRTVTTTILLAAHVGLFGPMFFSDVSLFTRFTFMVWALSLGLGFGIWLAFALGKPESRNKMQRLLWALLRNGAVRPDPS